MLRGRSFYKSSDFLNEDNKYKMDNYFNPYEYNLESSLKDQENGDLKNLKSKAHEIRNVTKK